MPSVGKVSCKGLSHSHVFSANYKLTHVRLKASKHRFYSSARPLSSASPLTASYSCLTVTKGEVRRQLEDLHPTMATGLDGISSQVSEELSQPVVSHICKMRLEPGVDTSVVGHLLPEKSPPSVHGDSSHMVEVLEEMVLTIV